MAATDLCTADEVAADLGVSADAQVQRVVTAASMAIASYCGRTFALETDIVEHPPGYGRPLLLLSRSPVVSIASIREAGALLDPSEYECIGENAAAGIVLRKRGRWMRTARDVGWVMPAYDFYEGETDLIEVTYTAGYVTPGMAAADSGLTVTLPADLREAAILSATAFYRRLGQDPNIISESIGDWSVTYGGTNRAIGRGGPLPDSVLPLLAPYVRVPVA